MTEHLGRGTYLKVFDNTGGFVICVPEDEPRVDAAVSAFVDSGGRDSLIDLTMLDGASFKTLSSAVSAWFVSTPESRKTSREIDVENERERSEHMSEMGVWDGDA